MSIYSFACLQFWFRMWDLGFDYSSTGLLHTCYFFLSGAVINDYISMNLGKYTGRNLSLSAFNFLSSVSAGMSFVDPYP